MRARISLHGAASAARIVAALAALQAALAGCGGAEGPDVTAGDAAQASAAASPSKSALHATDSVQPPAALAAPPFAIRAQRGVRLEAESEVRGADVGVVLPAPQRPGGGISLRVEMSATVRGGARLIAPAVRLGHRAIVGDVLTDRLEDDRNAMHGAVSAYVPVPPVEPLAPVAAGMGARTVVRRHARTLPPGAYGDVVVEPNAVLRLEGGDYFLASLRVASAATVVALSPARVRVAGRLELGSHAEAAIADGAGSAKDLRIEVAGADATALAADAETVATPAARLGERSAVRALVTVPAGALVVGPHASVTGAVVANAVFVRHRARIAFEDGFDAGKPAEPQCPATCDDASPCTADACVDGACVHEPVAAGTSCADGDACNGEEACDGAGACLAGVAPALDDGNPCTADLCDPVTGVSHLPVAVATSCSDGDACNGEEACDGAGTCLAGISPALDDGNVCTADACDAATGVSHLPLTAGTSCSDGNACNGAETCNGAATCLAGIAPRVDDGNPCTVDACDPAVGVFNLPLAAGASCSDGNACNGAETCDGAGICLAGVAPALDDRNPCTADACDPAAGVSHQPLAAGASCADGNACNGAETCDGAGTCLAGVAPIVDDDRDVCTVDACDPAMGVTHAVIAGCIESFADAAARLYTGSGAVQLGVQPGAIDPALVAVVRGKVLLRSSGGPLAGVEVTVFDHPELGHTYTRADGGFEMAVNGGAAVVLRYAATGSPTADRSVDVVKHDYATAPDAAVVPYDLTFTGITPSLPFAQAARAARVYDANGTRQAVLIFQPNLTATLELPAGGVLPLGPFRARTTEFTVGTAGPLALPAELPAGFAYQYAAEPSVDEAIAAGAEVVFSSPVTLYVEDYRGFAPGARLPISRYDRTIAAWLPLSDAIVLKLLGVSGAGVAMVDVDGDGVAETSAALAALGIGTPELQRLAALFPPGKTLWRASMARFGPLAVDWP